MFLTSTPGTFSSPASTVTGGRGYLFSFLRVVGNQVVSHRRRNTCYYKRYQQFFQNVLNVLKMLTTVY